MAELYTRIAEIPTFSTADGRPDPDAARSAVRALSPAGWDTVAVAGYYGSYMTLSAREQLELIEAALEGAGSARIAAGAFDAGTAKAAERIREHAAAGCHTHLCTVSYYFSGNAEDEWYRHFERLCRADPDGDLILVDARAVCGYTLPAHVLAKLSAWPQIRRIFLADPDPVRAAVLSGQLPVSVPDELCLTGSVSGGLVSRLAFLYPRLLLQPERLTASRRGALLALLREAPAQLGGIRYAAKLKGIATTEQPVAPLKCVCEPSAVEQAVKLLEEVRTV